MSHEIRRRDQVFSVADTWHHLEKRAEVITPEVAFPWNINLEPMFYGQPGQQKQFGRWVLPTASDDGLPIGVPINLATYAVRTPKDLWSVRDEVVAGVGNQVVTAGTVMDRARYFISSKLTELEKIKHNDGTESELIFNAMGSLDKSLHEQFSMSSIRIVCNNTLSLAFMTDKVRFRYRHSINMVNKVKEDKPLMQEVAGLAAVVKAAFDDLITKPCNVDRAHKIYTGLIVSPGQQEISKRAEHIVEQHVECFQRGKGCNGKTEFDLLNGFTHARSVGYDGSKKDLWSTFESSEFGAYAQSKESFADLLVNNRVGLDKVEARGRSLMEIRPMLVPV
jgi:hypothetical protein